MAGVSITRAAVAATMGLLGVAAIPVACGWGADSAAEAADGVISPSQGHAGLVHGRVVMDDGHLYEGRIRFGQDEEALWGNQFNGVRATNPWLDHAPADELPRDRLAWNVFGFEFSLRPGPRAERPFMARLGDITRIEARGRDLRVTLKSGTVAHLDRYEADDFADGVRVWDGARGIVDLSERDIRSIEFFSPTAPGAGPMPLHGTVRTASGDFSGFIQWEREAALETDYLHGRSDGQEVALRFDAIRSITREPAGNTTVTTLDGRVITLTDTRRNGQPQRGTYVDDARYGRVLISWDALRAIEFDTDGPGPSYDEFHPGHPLTGAVTTRGGYRISGRIVYDLDESESTETLDAPAAGVDYMIPFRQIAAIEPLGAAGEAGARVTLRNGERLRLERSGDLSSRTAGPLVFPAGGGSPEYVRWSDVARIDLGAPVQVASPGSR